MPFTKKRGVLGTPLCGAAPVVLLDPRRVDPVAQLRVEALAVRDADRLGVLAQVRVVQLEPVLEEAVVHLPEAALRARGLGRLGGERRTRVEVRERHVPEDEAELVAEALL